MADFQHINVKIFAVEGSKVDWHISIPVFHRWIREQATPEPIARCGGLCACSRGSGDDDHRPRRALRGRQSAESARAAYNRRTAGSMDRPGTHRQAYDAALEAARKLEQEPDIGGYVLTRRGRDLGQRSTARAVQ